MTILEIEERSGLPRANVRFYEKEGFISPTRGENGYRDYTRDELMLLKRIKLLRQLKIPLDDIRAMQEGGATLDGVIAARLREIDAEQKSLAAQREVCLELRSDGAAFGTLNPEKYIQRLQQTRDDTYLRTDAVTVTRAFCPWRRYFARSLDLALCQLLWYILAYLVFHWNISGLGIINTLIAYGLVLLIEPPLISLFGTTPGKSIFGIRVTYMDGARLDLYQSYGRTWAVFARGSGYLVIPGYNLYRLYKSYRACLDDGEMEWDAEHSYTIRDKSALRAAAYVLCSVIIAVAVVLTPYAADMPRHRGDLTAEELADNMNAYLNYHGYNWIMTPDGTLKHPASSETFIFDITEPVRFDIVTTDGYVTEFGFKMKSTSFLNAYQISEWSSAAFIAFAAAQPGMDFLSVHFGGVLDKLPSSSLGFYYEDCSFTENGIEVVFDFDGEIGDEAISASFMIRKTQ